MTGPSPTYPDAGQPIEHVVDRHGHIWRIVRDGGMATRAHETGIVTIGIAALERESGPLARIGPAEVEETITEWGFLYDGEPEWSPHAHIPWSRAAALVYRQDAELWRVSTKVGGLIHRERTTYVPRLTDWAPEIGERTPIGGPS